MSYIQLKDIEKYYGHQYVLKQTNLSVDKGEFVTLLGASGCGKSTLLRCIAGLETVSKGQVYLDGVDITFSKPSQRNVGMVFQQYSLFPNMTVYHNIAYGLKMKKMPAKEIEKEVLTSLELVDLRGSEKKYPAQLSGGERQRVALARSIVTKPKVLLLDEPLSAIDAKLRKSLQIKIKEIHKELNMTSIFVTHDQDEAMTMASRIGVMDAGRLEQVASPRDLYEAPASRWIAEFVGDINLFEGQIGASEGGRLPVQTRDAGLLYVAEPRTPPARTTVSVAIRPEKVKLSRRAPAADGAGARAFNCLEGVITEVGYLGGLTTYKVTLDSGAVVRSSMANTTRIVDAYQASQRVAVWFTPDDCLVLEQ